MPALAADDPQPGKIPTMSAKELDGFIDTVTALVGKDTLGLRRAAQAGDCLDLTRAANSFELGYGYLATVSETLAKRTEKEAQFFRAKAIQARVVVFAARVRVEEWLADVCGGYAVPADKADDPRYRAVSKIADPEFTQALIEARTAAETNLAIAVASGISAKCEQSRGAAQNITLLVPYLDKLLADTARRPQVLGPRASRAGLETNRRQLLAALTRLQSQYASKCAGPGAKPAP